MMKAVKELSQNLLSVTRAEELLAVKSKVHDEMGLTVLTLQHLYRGELDEDAITEIREFWERVLNDPRFLEDDSALNLPALKQRAKHLGLAMTVDGAWPEDQPLATKLLLAILREAMYNALRHGAATTMHVTLEDRPASYYLAITNNGTTAATIKESGGLATLRHRIESAGGHLELIGQPVFTLICELPKEVPLAFHPHR